jgi:hypothetical protein
VHTVGTDQDPVPAVLGDHLHAQPCHSTSSTPVVTAPRR